MYEAADDRLHELVELPPSDTGAPLPALVANEGRLSLVYVVSGGEPDWSGPYEAVLEAVSHGPDLAIVDFQGVYAHVLGPPNDEAIEGHPLYRRGLSRGTYRVESSSWIAALEAQNAVHPGHRAGFLDGYDHILITFKDNVFECVAREMTWRTERGPLWAALRRMAGELGHAD